MGIKRFIKKATSIVLACATVLSLGVTAFADNVISEPALNWFTDWAISNGYTG